MLDTSHFDTYDSRSFRQFCGPAQVHKDLNTLYGLIVGIQADGQINDSEIELLRAWIGSVSSYRQRLLTTSLSQRSTRLSAME